MLTRAEIIELEKKVKEARRVLGPDGKMFHHTMELRIDTMERLLVTKNAPFIMVR